jgi:acetyl esterase/lipase
MFRSLVATFLVLSFSSAAVAEDSAPIPLWANGAPGSESRKDQPELAKDWWVKNIHNPSVTAFLPPADKATGAAVVVCPGGGHTQLVFGAEGTEPAEYLASLGVAAFALKYRLGREEGSGYTIEGEGKADGQRAVRLVRSRAEEWGIDPARVGMLGFSAGGEIVSLTAFGSNDGDPNAADPIDRLSARPDFLMYVYPGPVGIPETIPGNAPPAFLLVANDDRGASRSIMSLLIKYREARIPIEAHLFAQGGHGFNMGHRSKLKTIHDWPQRMADWLDDNEFLKRTE